MKLPTIINKNLKVLIRSRSSALVVILGPLLLILLVGFAFSNSSTFTLNIGVYSPEYNNLTESFLAKLSNENYRIAKFSSEKECIDEIRSSGVHTCIIFPPGFEITNNKTNEVKIYIDQTKQNFVYAVVNTLSASIGKRSEELSLGLTTNIVDVLSRTQNTVSKAKSKEVADANTLSKKILDASVRSQSLLEGNDVNTQSISTTTGNLEKLGTTLHNRISTQYDIGMDLYNLSDFFYEEASPSFDENQTNLYRSELNSYGDTKQDKLYQTWNNSIAAKDEFINSTNQLKASVSTLVESVETSKQVQNSVGVELKSNIENNIKEVQKDISGIDTSMNSVLTDINKVQITSAENIVSPIVTNIETIVPEKSHLDYLFPSLIVLLIMFISILLSSTLIIMEKNSRAYFRNFSTPTNDFVFVLATFLTSLILMIVQILIVLIIAGLVFKTNLAASILNIGVLVIVISSFFILLGMIIGYIFNTEQTAMIGAISIGTLIMLTSDIIVPIENMPIYIQEIAKYNPFIIGSEALKKTILFSVSLKDIVYELEILGIAIAVGIIMIIIIQQLAKIRFINKFAIYKKVKRDVPENVKDIFKVHGEIVKDEKELYMFVHMLSRHDFKAIVSRRTNRIAEFAMEVLGDKELAQKLYGVKTKWGVLKVIESHEPKPKKIQKKPENPQEAQNK